MKSAARARRAARRTASRSASGRPRRMLSSRVPAKSRGCCGTQARCRRQSARSSPSRSSPVHQDAPGVRAQEAEQELDHGGLARPAGPHQGDPLPGADLDVQPAEGLAPGRVGEADPLQAQVQRRLPGAGPRSRRAPGNGVSRISMSRSAAAMASMRPW